ncbi:ROK family protein [bacterium]|nr:MAG: ROK family protein [bacterium]
MQLALSFEHDCVRALLSPDATQNGTRARKAFAPGSSPARQWLDGVELASELCARAALETPQLERAVVTFPSPLSGGVVLEDAHFKAWRGYDLMRGLREHLGVAEVAAMSNIEARARFESRFGALQNLETFFLVDIGERIESWARVGGFDLRAVHVGEQIIERDGTMDGWGRRGSLNAYCSDEALEGRAQSYGLGGHSSARLFTMAPDNFAAQSLCDEFCARLAQGICNAVTMLNGAPACISGPIVREAWMLLWPRLEPYLKAMWPPHAAFAVFAAQGDDDSALWGALS